MTGRQVWRVAAALVAVLFVWGLAVILGSDGDELPRGEVLGAAPAAGIDTVQLLRATDTILLARGPDGTWTANGYAADPDAVAMLESAFAQPLEGELAARSPGSHERMGVGDAVGTRLRAVAGGQTLGTIVVGQPGRDYQSVYVRRDGADEVYAVSGPLSSIATRSLNEWRDKRITHVDPAAIGRVDVVRGRRAYGIVRGTDGWRFGDGGPTDSVAVARLLDRFRDVVAQGDAFAGDSAAAAADFDPPDRRLTLSDTTGAALAQLLFDSTDAAFWVRRTDDPTVFRLFSWRVNELTPADSTLRRQ